MISDIDYDTVEYYLHGEKNKCQECSIESTSVQRVIDPLRYDIYNQEVWLWLCISCFEGRKYEV